jgi:putative permease
MSNSVKNILYLLILVAFSSFLYLIKGVLFPFLMSGVITYLLYPIVDYLTKFKVSRLLATLLIILLSYLILASILIVAFPLIYEQFLSFAIKIPEYKSLVLQKFVPILAKKLNAIDQDASSRITNYLLGLSSNILHYIFDLLNNLWRSSLVLINIISLLIITPIITFYFLRDFHNIVATITSYIPLKYKTPANTIFGDINRALSGYIRGQLNVCLIMATYYYLALMLLGLDFSFLVGIICGFLGFIPYIGILIGLLSAVILCLIEFGDLLHILLLMGIFAVGMSLENNVISPKIIGDKIGLHPVWMIFASLVGLSLGGIMGVVFAIPLAAISAVLIRALLHKYLNSVFFKK